MENMATNSKYDCDRIWSTEEIIENANNWSLAGDVALLNTIKSFSKNMLMKTEELSQNIDNLLNNVDEVGLKLEISQNQFHSLKNTQFIENRVYEDDETLDSKEEEKVVEKLPSEEEQEKMIADSVISGLEILNKYYDMVEVSISDTEEEEESTKSFILKPKDPYAHRPLPPVIGTEEWCKRWNSEDSSSDSEHDKMAEIYSESDSEDNLPKDLFKGSETSSELDFSSQTSDNRPAAHSTLNGSARPELVISGEDNEEPDSSTVNAPISSKSFAEQLAAKLDSVISTEEDIFSQINRGRIQPAKSNTFCGNLFPDEPPPLTEPEDTYFSKSAGGGLFSEKENLFDDVDYISHRNRQEISTTNTQNDDLNKEEQKRDNSRQNINQNISFLPKSSKVSRGLFDSDDSSDDEMFSTSKTQLTKPAFLQPIKPIVPLFDHEPPELKDNYKSTDEATKKKPTGGVSIFGNSNIFGNDEMRNKLKSQQQNLANDLFEEEKNTIVQPENVSKEVAKGKVQIKRKKFNLFEDDIDDSDAQEFKKELPSKNNIFVDDDADIEDGIFKKEPSLNATVTSEIKNTDKKVHGEVETEKKPLKNINLFDDDDFSNINVPKNKKKPNLFEDDVLDNIEVPTKKKNISLFDDDDDSLSNIEVPIKKNNISLFDDDDLSNINVSTKKKHISLFDDDDELFKDDLFSVITSKKFTSDLFDDLQNSNDLFGSKTGNVENIIKSDTENKFNENEVNEKDIANEVRNEKKVLLASEEMSQTSGLDDEDILKFEDNTETSSKEDTLNNNKSSEKTEDNSEVGDLIVVGVDKGQTHQLFGEGEENRIQTEQEQHSSGLEPKIATSSLLEEGTIPKYDLHPKSKQNEEKSVLRLFDSIPPPDDDDGDWDTKSDNFSDTEDYTPYRHDENLQRSSLFDDEPPSLGPNESSGIVRDHSTRVYTDDSSFNPYASSSRRLSSDIFSEQQSQDSFFVTKSRAESAVMPSDLDIIQEDSNISTVNTSSDHLEDMNSTEKTEILESENNLFADNLSVNQEQRSTISTDENKDDNVENLLFGQNFGKDIGHDDSILRNPKGETESMGVAKASQRNSTIASITDLLKNESGNKSETKVSPGKLKHTMNINVNALIPGYSAPKARELTKSQSLHSPNKEDWNFEKPELAHTSSMSVVRKNLSRNTVEKAVIFDDVDSIEVLRSVTKDRAKLPLNRRPSTRRGRQVAIRKSMVDVDSTSDDGHAEQKEFEITSDHPEIIPKKAAEEEKHVEEKTTEEKLSDIIKRDLNIPVAPNVMKDLDKEQNSSSRDQHDRNKGLFDSGSESDNDLFKYSRKKSKKEKKMNKSLFDDESSDEDLFSSASNSSATRTSGSTLRTTKKTIQKPVPVKKLENIQTTDDPLSDLFK